MRAMAYAGVLALSYMELVGAHNCQIGKHCTHDAVATAPARWYDMRYSMRVRVRVCAPHLDKLVSYRRQQERATGSRRHGGRR